MSKLLSWFKDLSLLKKLAAIGGVVLFVALLPFWLSISAMSAFFGGIAISLAIMLSCSARQRLVTLKLPGVKPERRPFVLAALILTYSIGATLALGVAATVTGDIWISRTQEKIQVNELYMEGNSESAKGNFFKASELYKDCVKIEPNHDEAQQKLEIAEGEIEAARKLYTDALSFVSQSQWLEAENSLKSALSKVHDYVEASSKLEEIRPSVEAARKVKTIETEVGPASYSIAAAKPVPSSGFGRSRFSYRITMDKTVTDKEVIITAIKDLLKNRATGDAVIVFVYGQGDYVQGAFTKARGQWSVDGKGWSGGEGVDRRLKVEFPSGEIEYRAFSK